MSTKKKPGQPEEFPQRDNPEVTPETVPDRPVPPFQEPEIVPEDDPGGVSPAEIPVPDEPSEPSEPSGPKPIQPQ
jgi:Predicted membrane protein